MLSCIHKWFDRGRIFWGAATILKEDLSNRYTKTNFTFLSYVKDSCIPPFCSFVCFLLHRFIFFLLKNSQQQWKLDLAVDPESNTSNLGQKFSSLFLLFCIFLNTWTSTETKKAFSPDIFRPFTDKSPESFLLMTTLAPPLLPQLSLKLDTLPPIPSMFLTPALQETLLSLLYPKKRNGLLGAKLQFTSSSQ